MNPTNFYYETSPRGNPILVLHRNRYVRNRESSKRTFWRCTKYYQNSVRCPGSVAISKTVNEGGAYNISTSRAHNDTCDQVRAALPRTKLTKQQAAQQLQGQHQQAQQPAQQQATYPTTAIVMFAA